MAKKEVKVSELEAGRPTKDQIAEWKKKHGNLFKVSVQDGENTLFAILRQPKMIDMEGASRETKKSPLSSVKYIVRNCSLYMDDAINKNDDLFMAICSKAEDIIEIKEASLEKL